MRRLAEKKRHELDLLCRAGVGLTPIAPAVCRLVREIVGAEACALFWLDAQGQPEGFFHEHAQPAAQELFLNEFERLFLGPAEINITTLAQTPGARIGRMLNVPASYYRSNTYNLLVRASGHHHTLDLRVDVQGRARAVLMLFRAREQLFQEQDAALLSRIEPYLYRALTGTAEASVWSAPASRSGHLLLADCGHRLLMFAGDAEALLKACTLVGQDVRVSGPLQAVPRFVRDLCARLHASGQPQARQDIDIPAGRLSMVAHRLQQAPLQPASDQILVALELQYPPRLRVVHRVLALGLSPLQREIALLAGVGGLRPDCERVIGVSNEALKKHLKTIYRAAGVAGWESLAATLQASGAEIPPQSADGPPVVR